MSDSSENKPRPGAPTLPEHFSGSVGTPDQVPTEVRRLPTGSGRAPVAPRPPGAPSHAGPASPRVPRLPVAPGEEMPARVQDYALLQPLGRGGMANVYLGQRRSDGKLAAVKLLLPQYAQDPEIVRRFMLEMKAGAGIHHENVVEVIEFGESDGRYFIASEYLDGGTVRDLALRAGGRLPPDAAEALAVQLLRGLAAAHRQRLVHRDVKPANVLLRSDGTAKLNDFGIARALELPGLTRTGLLMGTPAYMSPEQAAGNAVDGRSDLFAVGTVLFELLAGFNPFTGTNEAATVVKVLAADAPLLFEVNVALPAHLDAFVQRLLSREPEKRYANADDALSELARMSPAALAQPQEVLRRTLTDPAGAFTAWSTTHATRHYERAVQLLREGPARRPLAILELFRAHQLAPGHTQADKRLVELYGGRDPFAPPQNPKIAELEAELLRQPHNHALLMQLASLSKLELGLVRSIACYKRALKVRPDDAFAAGQLRQLIGEEADVSLAAMHLTLKTQPTQRNAAAPSAPVPAPPAPRPRTPGPQAALYVPPPTRPSLRQRLPTIVMGLATLLVAAWIVRGIGRFVKASQESSMAASESLRRGLAQGNPGGAPPSNAEIDQRVERLREEGEQQFQEALRLAKSGEGEKAEAALVRFRQDHPKSPRVTEATFVLGGVYLADSRASQASDELRAFVLGAPGDARVPEARLMLGKALAIKGDGEGALQELNALVHDHPASPVVTEALLRQGELYEAKGDLQTARARYEQVRARTGPADALYQQAASALGRLGK